MYVGCVAKVTIAAITDILRFLNEAMISRASESTDYLI